MRLIRAEALKLVRRRGLMIWSLLLTVGAVLIAEVIVEVLHLVNAAKHGPAGGTTNLEHYIFLVTGLGSVAAIIIGSTAGTQDVSNGVFRDLVVTGRPRKTLFAVRVPGALLVFLPMLAVGFTVAVAGALMFAGNLPHPGGSLIAKYAEYALAGSVIDIVIAVGLAAFASSRVVVGVLIAWNAIVSQLLMQIGVLGAARKGIDTAAVLQFAPQNITKDAQVHMDKSTALLVLVCWAVVFLTAGRWWTQRRDA